MRVLKNIFKINIINNSIWGAIANVLQNILFSIFFIIIARNYDENIFGSYVISNSLYSILLGFASLGLGNWFVRELINTEKKTELIKIFFKILIIVGVTLYLINNLLSFILYSNGLILKLSSIIGINIIFDNIIYVIRYINLSEGNQKTTFILSTVDAILKCSIGCLLLFYKIDIILISILIVIVRLFTLNLFLKYSLGGVYNIKNVLIEKIKLNDFKNIVFKNWAFVIISSVAILNWRIGSIIVSKYLSIENIGYYEISLKFLSIAYIIPIIVSTSIYPLIIKTYNKGIEETKRLYKMFHFFFFMYGLITYAIVYRYASVMIPYFLGGKYNPSITYTQQMFCVMLIFPTILLQANFLVAMKKEKIDMYCNITSLIINVVLCFVGLHFIKSIIVVNASIIISFLIFHLMQDYILIKIKISNIFHLIFFLIIIAWTLLYFNWSNEIENKDLQLIIFIFSLIIPSIFYLKKYALSEIIFKRIYR